MSVYAIARQLQDAEDQIDAALREQGDVRWQWHGTKSNPNVVPILWNNIKVTNGGNVSRILPATDYINEGMR